MSHGTITIKSSIQVDKLSGWNSLSSSDQSAISDLAKKGHPMNKGGMMIDMFKKVWFLLPLWLSNLFIFHCCYLLTAFLSGGSGTNIEMEEGKESTQKHTSKGGTKRGKDADSERKSKVAKAKGDVSVGSTASVKNYNEPGESRDLAKKTGDPEQRTLGSEG